MKYDDFWLCKPTQPAIASVHFVIQICIRKKSGMGEQVLGICRLALIARQLITLLLVQAVCLPRGLLVADLFETPVTDSRAVKDSFLSSRRAESQRRPRRYPADILWA